MSDKIDAADSIGAARNLIIAIAMMGEGLLSDNRDKANAICQVADSALRAIDEALSALDRGEASR